MSLDLIWAGKGRGETDFENQNESIFYCKNLVLKYYGLATQKSFFFFHPIGILFSSTQNLYVDFRSLKMHVSRLSRLLAFVL